MKSNLFKLIALPLALISLAACSMGKPITFSTTSSSSAAGRGNIIPGVGALSVPTGDALVARIQNGLENTVSAQSGNFAKSLAQLKGNLPKMTDPTQASGFDQAQLLVYAACSDLTTGNTPIMQSKYNVNPKTAISANQQALVSAGMEMLDQYTAGIASQSEASSNVTTALNNLVQTISAQSGSTSKIAFMSVCIAANTAGSSMMGF